MFHRWQILGVPALIAGCLVATPIAAQAAPDDPKPTHTEEQPFAHVPAAQKSRMQQQAPLVAAAQRLRDRIESGPHAGYTGISLTSKGVSVYWKGTAPAGIQALVRGEKTASLHPARYSRTELRKAEKQAMVYITATDGPVYGVRVPADGSGLVAQTSSPISTATVNRFRTRALDSSSVKIRMEVAPAPKPSWRQDDYAPYYGGGRITTPGGGWCSSGFAVRQGSTQYLLTAGHCGWTGGVFKNGDATRTVGAGERKNLAHDIMLITAGASGRIWDGGGTKRYEDRAQFTKAVSGWGDTFPNEWICQSGMTSGAQCNIQNSLNFSYSYSFGGETYTDLVLAYSVGGIASRPGDSGGPVFTLNGDKVTAKGTISGSGSSYPIKVSYNGKCLDADANNLNRNGTRIQLWDCNNSMQQNFVFNNDGSIRSATNQAYCLDADLGTINGNGTIVQLWQCNGSAQQQWKFNGSVAGPIRSIYNNRCLDAHLGAINTNGAKVQLWDCNNTGQQGWGPQTRVLYQDFRTASSDFGITTINQ
ncbi:ricin-type beta-trefoil lectin domain protein [Kineosporia sp. NBRC 101731]|uniref:ricin-type beta-trefoil lectin domain protein n=1 Tax=Kineosporia sp. NBRC 101731 TaxID=3032199 RepID=UPI0025574468|nr:ricin-type beta-trefoil lectin domain protein [Kineosporia sp. NBRC 101731]